MMSDGLMVSSSMKDSPFANHSLSGYFILNKQASCNRTNFQIAARIERRMLLCKQPRAESQSSAPVSRLRHPNGGGVVKEQIECNGTTLAARG